MPPATIIRGCRSAPRHIRSDCRQREGNGVGIGGKGDADPIVGEAAHPRVDHARFGMVEPDLALERRPGVGFEKRAAA